MCKDLSMGRVSEKTHILIVDDDQDVSAAMAAVLEAAGYVPVRASSPQQASEKLTTSNASIALLDVHLGASENGLELISQLVEKSPRLKCIAMTAHAEVDSAIEAVKAGAYAYLPKPVAKHELLGTLDRCLARIRLEEEKNRAEQELLQATNVLNSILDSATEFAIVATDLNHRFIHFNPSAERIYGVSAKGIIGRTVDEVPQIPGLTREYLDNASRITCQEGKFDQDIVLTRTDGTLCYLHAISMCMRDPAGQCIGLICISHDITQRKLLEDQLRQAQKMEAIGRLAGGIAHDFNNQLTVILGYSQLLLQDLGENSPHRPLLEEILNAANRSHDVTRQLLAFSRRQVLHPQNIDLNRVILDLANPLGRMVGEQIELSVIPAAEESVVEVDPRLVEQALMNLVINSSDALPDGGKITIETATVNMEPPLADLNSQLKAGKYVLLAVSDNGMGMDEETQKHIFEPFFTTKPVGKGTGLGLAMVYGFVKQTGGHIEVYSQPGHGTTFKMYLSAVASQEASSEDAIRPIPYPTRSETILVVEDDETVRQLLVRVLRECGYTVLEAANAKQAIPLGEHYDSPIDLLVTDVVMPAMNGPALVNRLSLARPDMKVLFITGYAEHAAFRHGLTGGENRILTKPFGPEQLARTVFEVLTPGTHSFRNE